MIQDILLNDLLADEEFNCRGAIRAIDVVDLAKSIEKDGLLSPITITPLPEGSEKKFKIIAGYRRFTAFEILKRETIPCIIRENLDDTSARILNLTENLARQNLNIMQEAKSIKHLYDAGYSDAEIADMLPECSRGWVQVRMMLLKLPPSVQKEAEAGILSQANIRDLYSMFYNNVSEMEICNTIKLLKAAKEKGETFNVKKHKERVRPKKKGPNQRSVGDTRAMIDHIILSVGENLGTRCLAWTTGTVTDDEMFKELAKIAELKGLEYEAPIKL